MDYLESLVNRHKAGGVLIDSNLLLREDRPEQSVLANVRNARGKFFLRIADRAQDHVGVDQQRITNRPGWERGLQSTENPRSEMINSPERRAAIWAGKLLLSVVLLHCV